MKAPVFYPDEIDVREWHPTPEGSGPPDGALIIRFKSPRTLDQLIDALTKHREGVWGKR